MRAAAIAVLLGACTAPDFTFELSVTSTEGIVTLDGVLTERVERTASSYEAGKQEIAITVVVELPAGRLEEVARPGLCQTDVTIEAVRYRVRGIGPLYPQLETQQCDGLVLIND